MPPFRVEYLCLYRPLWRWDGAELGTIDEAIREALTVAMSGRQVRIVDCCDHVIWPE